MDKTIHFKKNNFSLFVSLFIVLNLRWPNTVYARFTDSVSDAIKRALGLW